MELRKVQEVGVRITGRSLVSECILYVSDYSNMCKKSKKNKQTKVVIAKCSQEPEISKFMLPLDALSVTYGIHPARQCLSPSFFLFPFFFSSRFRRRVQWPIPIQNWLRTDKLLFERSHPVVYWFYIFNSLYTFQSTQIYNESIC